MIDFNRPVQTRDGRKADVLRSDLKNDNYPVVGFVTEHDGREHAETWTADGKFSIAPERSQEDELDLVNAPEKRTVWLNAYPSWTTDQIHPNKMQADIRAGSSRITCIEITYEVPST